MLIFNKPSWKENRIKGKSYDNQNKKKNIKKKKKILRKTERKKDLRGAQSLL
jgi:hypothetical protein